LAIALCSTAAGTAAADSFIPLEPERLPAFGRSVVGNEDTMAIYANPANVAYLPGAELRWEGVFLQESLRAPWQGNAVMFGFPLPFGLATGLRLDLINPSTNAFVNAGAPPRLSANYQWLTWALAFRASESLAFGFSLQRSYSDGIVADSLGSYSAALTVRPMSAFGLSFVGSQINGPLDGNALRRFQTVANATCGVGCASAVSLGPSLTTALAIRPWKSRSAELGLEARYLFQPAIWEPRATLGFDLPYVGRLRGEFRLEDPTQSSPAWLAAATLSIYVNGSSGSSDMEGGAITGTALGQSGSYNPYFSFAVRSFREPVGLPNERMAAKIRIESTPDNRGHVALLRKLWRLSEDDEVVAVALELRTSPADSIAHVQELRDAVRVLQARGKKVLCHLEDASGSALYLCAAADRILINPAGGLRFAGLRTRHFYLADLLHNLGINADFVRIGAHKSAPEEFTRTDASPVARADSIDLLQQNELWFSGDIAHDRGISVETLRARIASGPFVATEAKAAGLVDGYAYDDEVEAAVRKLVGDPHLPLLDADRAPIAPEHFGAQRSIALLYVDGDIIDGRNRSIPFLGMDLAGSYTIADTLRQIRESPLVSAVVLRIESPGGSSMASDVMWREVQLTAQRKPVIVSMGEVAASGGYYIAAPATRIYANPLTVTGSIGVFYGKADVSGLLAKIGVNVEVYKTTPRADAESIFRPFTPEERQELVTKVGQFYSLFITRVAEGRHMSMEAVDHVGQGRVWTGQQAKANGLVDELGGLRQALDDARRRGGLPEDAPIIELPKIPTSLLGRILGIEGVHAAEAANVLPSQVTDLARAMAPFLIHPSDKPLSRLEFSKVEP
jgi:protease-4